MVNQQRCQSDGFFQDYCLISLFRGKNQLGHQLSGSWKEGSSELGGGGEGSQPSRAAGVGLRGWGRGGGRALTRADLKLEFIEHFIAFLVAAAQSVSTIQRSCKSSES